MGYKAWKPLPEEEERDFDEKMREARRGTGALWTLSVQRAEAAEGGIEEFAPVFCMPEEVPPEPLADPVPTEKDMDEWRVRRPILDTGGGKGEGCSEWILSQVRGVSAGKKDPTVRHMSGLGSIYCVKEMMGTVIQHRFPIAEDLDPYEVRVSAIEFYLDVCRAYASTFDTGYGVSFKLKYMPMSTAKGLCYGLAFDAFLEGAYLGTLRGLQITQEDFTLTLDYITMTVKMDVVEDDDKWSMKAASQSVRTKQYLAHIPRIGQVEIDELPKARNERERRNDIETGKVFVEDI